MPFVPTQAGSGVPPAAVAEPRPRHATGRNLLACNDNLTERCGSDPKFSTAV